MPVKEIYGLLTFLTFIRLAEFTCHVGGSSDFWAQIVIKCTAGYYTKYAGWHMISPLLYAFDKHHIFLLVDRLLLYTANVGAVGQPIYSRHFLVVPSRNYTTRVIGHWTGHICTAHAKRWPIYVEPLWDLLCWKCKPEAKFLDVTGTKVLWVFLLAIHSHLY
jgi:hypothetical protein